jgi:PKD repeat protein
LDGWDPNQPTASLDAGIQGVNNPSGILCSTGDFTPEVVLRNFGSTTLTSVDIEYSIDGGATSTYAWTGSLASNNTVVVVLPAQSTGNGVHTFEASTTNPNGGTDENLTNNGQVGNFEVVLNGQLIDFDITLDCWGSEVTWFVEDGSNNQIYTGGPYTDGTGGTTISEQWCLNVGCYTFTIEDSYGDGMHGSQYPSCTFDGTYSISQGATVLAEIIAVDSDYGDIEVNPFCVAASITADFEADVTTICAGESVTFTDLSSGTITTWDWTFEGGVPGNSGDQNPIVNYPNPGTYDVTLTVSDGVDNASVTFTDYITVHAAPAAPIVTPSGPTSICAGSSVNLTSSYPSGNVWSTTETTSSISVNSTGGYSVTYTDGNGCQSVSGVTNITVNPIPTISIGTIVDPSVCGTSTGSIQVQGSGSGVVNWSGTATGNSGTVSLPYTISNLTAGSYNLTFTSAAGCTSGNINQNLTDPNPPATPTITPSGATTFCAGGSVNLTSSYGSGNTWSTSATANSINVTTSGTYSVTYTDGSGCSASSSPVVVTVNANPSAPTITPSGATTFCDGGSLSLTSSQANGNIWSTSATSNVINVTGSGSYTVTYADGNGCSATSAATVVTVNSNPSAPSITPSGATTFCAGESVDLTSSQANGNTWSTTAISNSITVTSSGSYTVTYTDGNGCSATSLATAVTVNPAPNVAITPLSTVCVYDNSSALTGGSPAGGTYSGTGVSGSNFDPATAGIGTHPITYTYIDGNGCEGMATTNVTVDGCASLEDNQLNGVSVYPNPTDNKLFIVFDGNFNVEILDMRGRVIEKGTGEGSLMLNTSNYNAGVYFIKVTSESLNTTVRIVKN